MLPVTDPSRPTDQIEVGWHLHPDYQAQGLITEAATAILAAAARAGIGEVIAWIRQHINAATRHPRLISRFLKKIH